MQESSLGAASPNVMQVNGYENAGADSSIDAGTKMLADLFKKTGGDTARALAAYNMGPGILNFMEANPSLSVPQAMAKFSEQQKAAHGYKVYGDPEYVSHVMRYYNQ